MADVNARSTLRTLRLAISLVLEAGRRQFLVILAATVVTSLAIAGQLLVGRTLLDLLAENERVDAGDLAPYLAVFGVLLVVSALSQAIANELRIPLGEKLFRRTMDEVLDVSTEIELEAYEGTAFHDQIERARLAASGRSMAVVFGLVTILSTLVVAVGVGAVILTVAPILLPIAVIGYLPVAWVNVHNNRSRYQMELDMTELLRDRSYLEFVMTERDDAKEVRSFDIAATLRTWHGELWRRRLDGLRTLVRRRLALSTIGTVVTSIALVATLSLALILAGRGTITIGDAAVAIVGLQQLSGRLQAMGGAFTGVHEGITFLRDFESFRASLPVIRQRRPTGVPPSPPQLLSVEALRYRYPGARTDAVRSVSFELQRGQVMAIVGANGSGKSTVAKLVCGLLPPSSGRITWDGVDLATCDPQLVRSQIAPVFQDYSRYHLTIRQAIGLGNTRRLDDDEAILDAARRAGLAGVIAEHPKGLDTRLGKMFSDGIDLSIGQWQRLAIARAMLRGAPVMVLDEPSASLDPRVEAELFDLLQAESEDRMVVYVSHRFATVRSADLVLVLDQGEIVELGPHDVLMKADGLYADLFNLQAERYGLR